MIPSVSLEAERELIDGALFYAREANAELGLAFIAEFERSIGVLCSYPALALSGAAPPADFPSGASRTASSISSSPMRFGLLPSPSEPPARLLAWPEVVALPRVQQSLSPTARSSGPPASRAGGYLAASRLGGRSTRTFGRQVSNSTWRSAQ